MKSRKRKAENGRRNVQTRAPFSLGSAFGNPLRRFNPAGRGRTLILCWMVATTAHLPVPVCDGDTAGSRPSHIDVPLACSGWVDIDFILLGCDGPDDPDDGPIDDDPEDRPTGPFPVFVQSHKSPSLRAGKSGSSWSVFRAVGTIEPPAFATTVLTAYRDDLASIPLFAERNLRTATVMRC